MSEDDTPKNKGGRPRVANPKSGAQRQRESTEALKLAGGFRSPISFTPEAAKAIDTLMDAHGYKDKTETVNTTLIKAASRVKR